MGSHHSLCTFFLTGGGLSSPLFNDRREFIDRTRLQQINIMAEKDQNTILPWQRIAIEGFQEIVHVWGCRTLSGLCKDGCLAQGTLMKLDPRCPDGSIRLETVVKMTGRLMTLAHVFFKGEKQQEVLGTLGAVLASVAMATAVLTPAELARAARRKRLRN